ncbi:MAG: DUF3990 domain-containing protein [Planctomycetaceae bacterium]|jgi:hypothetical protein|nr:DUF3990 domain-containing protein [Planctomycetaceae bacterium]
MIIYHGSYCEIQTPLLKAVSQHKDFGRGFYCTEMLQQAERWAKRFDPSVVNTYDFVPNSVLSVLEFDKMTEAWLDFIVESRQGKSHNYDVVIGAMANDQIWNYIADFISGVLTREQFWVLAKFKHPTHQIAFCTQNALDSLTFKESRKIIP